MVTVESSRVVLPQGMCGGCWGERGGCRRGCQGKPAERAKVPNVKSDRTDRKEKTRTRSSSNRVLNEFLDSAVDY